MPTLPTTPTSDNLTFMRTLLASGVLCFHTTGLVGINYPQFPWVPAFIAISGYVITQSISRSRGYTHFAWKRLLRVDPAFLMSLALVATLGGSVQAALIDWLSILLNLSSKGGANGPLWSLSLEEVLYFSLALLFAVRLYDSQHRTLPTLVVLFFLVPLAVRFLPVAQAPIAIVSSAFICGSFLYVIKDQIRWSPLAGFISLAVAVGLRNYDGLKGTAVYALLIGPPLAYGLITVTLHTKPIFGSYKQTIGDPSLGIYVFHWPIMIWLQSHCVGGFWLTPATLGLTLVLALLSWHCVERHILRLKDWRLIQPLVKMA